MVADINNSKEAIRNRMLKHALNYWDIKNTEDLDPVVKLMMEALSVELYNVSNQVADTQVRMLEKIAGLLAPEYLTSANPAHALLHAKPVESFEILSTTTSFSAQQKISINPTEPAETSIDINFTPVGSVKITDVQMVYIKAGTELFAIDQALNKHLITRAVNGSTLENNTVWIGLKINPDLDNIDDHFFCFDFKNVEPQIAESLYQLLPATRWYIGDKEIKKDIGLPYIGNGNGGEAFNSSIIEHNVLALLESDIKHFYNRKYITIKDVGSITELRENYPRSFDKFFAENELKKLNEKLSWIKIVFPAAVKPESLAEANIYVNTFPVVNRKLLNLNFRLKGGSNIVPLKTLPTEQFLSVKSLSDGTHNYKAVHFQKMDDEETGFFTVRNGGVERFDTRNARELLSYLLELLRSESSAFAAYGYDFIATALKEMNQRMVLIEQKTKGLINNTAEIPNYIIVKPFDDQDMMYVEYWTTMAESANAVRSGTKLQQVSGVRVKGDSIILMTTTTGGKSRLKSEDRLAAFKYGIMTRNRIVTKEDIRNFCFYELGKRIKDVVVEKGLEMSLHPNQSFTRTINIILIPSEVEILNTAEWEMLFEQLKSKLEARSGVSNHYRISLGSARLIKN